MYDVNENQAGTLGQTSNTDPLRTRRSISEMLRVGAFKFYYAYAGILNRLMPHIRLDGKKIYVAPSVYKPLEHEQRLADTCKPSDRVLDLGCGTGVAAVFSAMIAKDVVASDISPGAVENARRNCELHGLSNVTTVQSDMFEAIEGKFDLIITHPPYFQLEMKGDDAHYATSMTFVDVLFSKAKDYLADGGRLLVQYPKAQGQRLERLGNAGGLRLTSSQPAQRKGLGLLLTSLLYLQFGNESHQYFFERADS